MVLYDFCIPPTHVRCVSEPYMTRISTPSHISLKFINKLFPHSSFQPLRLSLGGTPLVPAIGSGGSPAVLRRNGNGAALASAGTPGTTLHNNPPPPLYSPTPNAVLVPASVNGNVTSAASAAGSSGTSGALTGTTAGSLSTSGSAGTSGAAANSAQEFSFKAKQEVYVLQRISELQREGLWTEKRLPKLQEPSRPKAHWDYLLEEMVWLAADFAQERKWKKNAAKKCAKMVQKYFQDKANAAQKAEKAHEAHLKRIAAFLSKEVKMFWSNVEKLVEYKHHTKLEEKRKKALDQHLSFIVDQTEKFSQQLAEGMNKSIIETAAGASGAPSMDSSRISSPKRETAGNGSDDDFRPESGSEDDEETIAKAEEEAADVKEEVAALEKESQMDLDDFLKDLPKGYLENRDKILLEEVDPKSSQEDDADDTEFEANEDSDDDENTISKQEEEEKDIDHQKEIDELEADNDLTVEQLLEKYKSGKIDEPKGTLTRRRGAAPPAKKRAKMEIDSDDDEVENDTSSSEGTVVETESESDNEEETNDEENSSDVSEENEQEDGLKSLLEDTEGNSKDDMIKDAAALAESIQPKGNTLSSTNVVTPVPFLLKHSLREYQHIGLDWLVTMNERKLNGILADEMGLGKTIQTIALLAHLACVKGNWGPHLIVVPSSVMLNWEMEFKKWCPAFKILTYYGTQKERKLKRVGWTKPNAFHVCITSYKLVVQDQQSFRRKKWKYLILDEAQNIKNFKSQRWQLLLNFSTERRLLLTGTPLQNDLMELWSLMHFLMPYVFSSHREFKEWFSNPMTGMIEGNMEYNETLISRLHKVIRPFLLRRLKKEVEKQMPKKYEHVVMCRLSNRQRYLYEDFMSRSKTKETLQTGNLLSVINVLMQLRKVCNHPNMFEVRPTISPFQMEGITYEAPRLVYNLLDYDPFTRIDLHSLNLLLIDLELTLTAYVSHKSRVLEPPRKLIEEIDSAPAPPPPCPRGKFKFYIRVRDQQVQQNLSQHSTAMVRVGASPAMRTDGKKVVPLRETNTANLRLVKRLNNINPVNTSKLPALSMAPSTSTSAAISLASSGVGGSIRTASGISVTRVQVAPQASANLTPPAAKIAKLVQHGSGKPYFLVTSSAGSSSLSDTVSGSNASGSRLTLVCKSGSGNTSLTAMSASSSGKSGISIKPKPENSKLLTTIAQQVKSTTTDTGGTDDLGNAMDVDEPETAGTETSESDPIYNMQKILEKRKEQRLARLKLVAAVNRRCIEGVPIYGADCRETLTKCVRPSQTLEYSSWQTRSHTNCCTAMARRDCWTLSKIIKSYEKRVEDLRQTFSNFVIYVPPACAPRIRFYVQHLTSGRLQRERRIENTVAQYCSPKLTLLHPVISAMTTQFPDPRLIQYDCGKLQTLDLLLRQLKSGQHRVLIFTQMTKMLDVLEAFLNYHGHIYLRLDGSTRVEQRQVLMERFNGDKRIFCFILSTRSGGVGVNLTGADTVIFYDSDWNPTMDAQAQDRCHRIGQTRDVHIYRLVSEKTIEVNILKKANQKRMLSDMAIEGGNFTTTYFKSSTIKDLFNLEQGDQDGGETAAVVGVANGGRAEKPTTSSASAAAIVSELGSEIETEKQSLRAFESALAAAEDEQDVQATKTAKAEAAADLAEFDETIPIDETTTADGAAAVEMSKADLEMQNLVKQLSPIERYAMRFVEETGAAWTAEQLRAAEEEIEAQKREWEANRLAALQKEEEMLKKEAEADEMLTYNRKDASNQVNNKNQGSTIRRKAMIKSNRRVLKKQLGRGKVDRRRRSSEAATTLATSSRAVRARQNSNMSKRRAPVKTRRGTNQCLRGKTVRAGRANNASSKSRGNSVEREKEPARSVQGSAKGSNMRRAKRSPSPTASEDDLETATTVKSTRKTTRTSMAAAAAATTADTDCDILSNDGTTNDKRVTAAGVRRNATGVKNQRLLNRRLLRLKANSVATTQMRKRKISGGAAAAKSPPAKRKPVEKLTNRSAAQRRQLRNSPQKNASANKSKSNRRRESESDDNEDEEEEDDDEVAASDDKEEIEQSASESEHIQDDSDKDEAEDDSEQEAAEDIGTAASAEEDDTENENMNYDSAHSHCSEDLREEESQEDVSEEEEEKAKTARKKSPRKYSPHWKYNSRANNVTPPPPAAITEDESAAAATAEGEESQNDASSYVTVLDTAEHDFDDDVDEDEEIVYVSDNNANDDNVNDNDSENEKTDARTRAFVNERRRNDSEAPTNSNSLDVWNAHTQIQDTTMTNSTYYNVSDESDSDENETPLAHLNASATKRGTANSSLSATKATATNVTLTPAAYQNHVDVNSPRTRSRGAVKINLWTLDVSPVLPDVRSGATRMSKKDTQTQNRRGRVVAATKVASATEAAASREQCEDEMGEEEHLMDSDAENATSNHKPRPVSTTVQTTVVSTPNCRRAAAATITTLKLNAATTHRRRQQKPRVAVSAANIRTGTTTLHRWLLKTTKTTRAADVDASSEADEGEILDPLADNSTLSSMDSTGSITMAKVTAKRSSNGPT
ncbi:helicase domino-like isoform X2 [Rhagoletis pomonella]|uniref:helicase domino-like isoform X2 n=1 Tax=Rhagoletis pomonella TaxID=28610 RepID=UPI0017848737|nr:helicase domino-like isoform X2 [Rhagoletis pomonella]